MFLPIGGLVASWTLHIVLLLVECSVGICIPHCYCPPMYRIRGSQIIAQKVVHKTSVNYLQVSVLLLINKEPFYEICLLSLLYCTSTPLPTSLPTVPFFLLVIWLILSLSASICKVQSFLETCLPCLDTHRGWCCVSLHLKLNLTRYCSMWRSLKPLSTNI